jgi:hypothetical protein
MLNLQIAMLQSFLLLVLVYQTAALSITSPQADAVVRGQVEIQGRMNLAGFSSAELAFGYAPAGADATLTGNWFVIQSYSLPVSGPLLAIWDTTSVTDGDYNLRMRVFLEDGSMQEVVVSKIKIRNDMPVPTETPAEVFQPVVPSPTPTIMPTMEPRMSIQPTPIPPNPAALSIPMVYSTFGRGVLVSILLFGIVSLLLRTRKN